MYHMIVECDVLILKAKVCSPEAKSMSLVGFQTMRLSAVISVVVDLVCIPLSGSSQSSVANIHLCSNHKSKDQ